MADELQAKLDAALSRAREVVLREFLDEHRSEVVEGDASEPVKPKRMATVVSLRMDADLAGRMREFADSLGVSVSDLLRVAADRAMRPRGLACAHYSITGDALVNATGPCGCVMAPMYHPITC